MARLKLVHAVSDDDDLSFFAQDYAHIRKAANLAIDEIGEDAATYAADPICSVGRAMFWEPRPGDVSRQ